MLTIDQAREALSRAADELPQEIFRELNGGISLLPDIKLHPKSANRDYFILGEYFVDLNGLGRYISIYYGSFQRAHGHLSDEAQKGKLEDILYHELTHHLESLAGDKSLEIKDAQDLAEYLRRYKKAKR
jgi:hypothetical protein